MTYASSLVTLERLGENPPQALIVSGLNGIDLTRAAMIVSGSNPVIISRNDSKTQNNITVEQIRTVYDQAKTTRSDSHTFIIEDADTMSRGAQAAFLKLLEEPNRSIHFILTTHHVERLTDTIKSRAQTHLIQPMTHIESKEYILSRGVTDERTVSQLLFIAEGLPDELDKLIDDSQYFENMKHLVTNARDYLQVNSYEKLLLLDSYKDDRQQYLYFIEMIIKLAKNSLSKSPHPQTITQLERLLELENHIRMQGNIRLHSARHVV